MARLERRLSKLEVTDTPQFPPIVVTLICKDGNELLVSAGASDVGQLRRMENEREADFVQRIYSRVIEIRFGFLPDPKVTNQILTVEDLCEFLEVEWGCGSVPAALVIRQVITRNPR